MLPFARPQQPMINPYATNSSPGGNPIAIGGSGIQTPGFVSTEGPAFKMLSNLATNKGLSPWAMAATKSEDAKAAAALESGQNQVAGDSATTDASLAANGGLSSGARERAKEGAGKNYLSMVQDVNKQRNLNTLQIGENDAQNKIQQAGTVAGMEQNETAARNDYNKNLYNQQMEAWAAAQQAKATAAAGKK